MEVGGKQMMRGGTWRFYRIVVRSELGDRYGILLISSSN
jgi:hypothetical protein